MRDLEQLASEKVAQTRKMPHWEPDDGSNPESWGTFLGHHRDSGLLDESNWDVVTKDMLSQFPEDVEIVRFGHWAVGWVEEMFVRMRDAAGNFTPAFVAAAEWAAKLEDYPIADEMAYSELVWETSMENFEQAASPYLKPNPPKDWFTDMIRWFEENADTELEDRDDQGAYPDEDILKVALYHVKALDEDYFPELVRKKPLP